MEPWFACPRQINEKAKVATTAARNEATTLPTERCCECIRFTLPRELKVLWPQNPTSKRLLSNSAKMARLTRGLLRLGRPLKLVFQFLRLYGIGLLLQPHERIERTFRLFGTLSPAIELRQLVVRLPERLAVGLTGVGYRGGEAVNGSVNLTQLRLCSTHLVMRIKIFWLTVQNFAHERYGRFRFGPLQTDDG